MGLQDPCTLSRCAAAGGSAAGGTPAETAMWLQPGGFGVGAAASDPSLGTDRLRLHLLKHNLTDLYPQINDACTQVSPSCPGPSGTQGCSALRCEEELRKGMDASLLLATTACSECSRDSCSPKHSNIPWGLLATGQKAGLDHIVLPCAAPHWCPVAQDRREGSSPAEPTGDVTPPGEDRDQPMDKLKPFSSQHPISAPCHQAASMDLPGTHCGWSQGSAARGVLVLRWPGKCSHCRVTTRASSTCRDLWGPLGTGPRRK